MLALNKIEGPKGYNDFGEGDRHGSYEWTWYKLNGEFARFVSVASTPRSPLYQVEIWIGADNGKRFTHRLVARFNEVDIGKLNVQPMLSHLQEQVDRAGELADKLEPHDLEKERPIFYPPKRTSLKIY